MAYGTMVRDERGKIVGQGVVPDPLRHYCATGMTLNGKPLAGIAKCHGIRERVLNEHYSHIQADDFNDLVADSPADNERPEDDILRIASGA
jgi:hypothetical protein